MRESESLKRIHEIRRDMLEEEKRLGPDEFVRRQRERVEKFLRGTRARLVPSGRTDRRRAPL